MRLINMLVKCGPIILLMLTPVLQRFLSPSVNWGLCTEAQRTSVFPEPERQIRDESNDRKNGMKLFWKDLQDMVFCSSKEMSPLHETHCWAQKAGSVGSRGAGPLLVRAGSSRDKQAGGLL